MSVLTIKILLKYLQEKNAGSYTRAINELNEKRAIILGVRNKLAVKKESANQDRFCDSLYYIPGNASDGTNQVAGSTGATGSGSVIASVNKKNESLSAALQERIDELTYISESGLWNFEDYELIEGERNFLLKYKPIIENGEMSECEFFNIYEGDSFIKKAQKKLKDAIDKASKIVIDQANKAKNSGGTPNPAATGPANLGDMINPYQITTVPSLAYYGKKPMNPKGVGIKLPGDTLYILQESTLGDKQKYKMMVESEKIKVGRYPIGVTKFETYKPAETYTENCGMQIHRSSTKGVGVCVGPWSAGCQVFADYTQWQEFISKAEKESMNAGKFIYALIQLDDIPDAVMESALKGMEFVPPQEQPVASDNSGSTGATGETGKKVSPGSLKKFGRITED